MLIDTIVFIFLVIYIYMDLFLFTRKREKIGIIPVSLVFDLNNMTNILLALKAIMEMCS